MFNKHLNSRVASFTIIGASSDLVRRPIDERIDLWPAATEGPLKVSILSGQSNMQGYAALRTLEHLIHNEETVPKLELGNQDFLPTQNNAVVSWEACNP